MTPLEIRARKFIVRFHICINSSFGEVLTRLLGLTILTLRQERTHPSLVELCIEVVMNGQAVTHYNLPAIRGSNYETVREHNTSSREFAEPLPII